MICDSDPSRTVRGVRERSTHGVPSGPRILGLLAEDVIDEVFEEIAETEHDGATLSSIVRTGLGSPLGDLGAHRRRLFGPRFGLGFGLPCLFTEFSCGARRSRGFGAGDLRCPRSRFSI
jgi:hypothetical protein